MGEQVLRGSRGVTLTELLTAAGGLGCLLAMVLSAITGVKDSADRTACAANLSRLGEALFFYASDHDDLLPDSGACSTRGGDPPIDGRHFPSGLEDPGTCDRANVFSVGNQANLWILVREGYAAPRVFLCPATADRASLNAPADGAILGFLALDPSTQAPTAEERKFLNRVAAGRCSYSYQNQFAHPQTSPDVSDPLNATTHVRMHPRSLAILADRNPYTRTDFVRQPVVSPEDQPEANSPNHGGSGQNVLYLDGTVRWQTSPRCGSAKPDGSLDNIYWPEVGQPTDPLSLPCSIYDSFLVP